MNRQTDGFIVEASGRNTTAATALGAALPH